MRPPASNSSPESRPVPGRAIWLLLAVFCLGVNLSLPWIEPGDGQTVPRFAVFLGRFHPMILHFPIGFIVLAALIELGRMPFLRRIVGDIPTGLTTFLLACSAVAATATTTLGWLLSYSGGYETDLLQRHFRFGIATGATIAAALFLNALGPGRMARVGSRVALTAAFGLIGLAGHFGAAITHGEDYLTEFAPNPVRLAMGLPPFRDPANEPVKPVADRVIFADVVHPIFAERCTSCHSGGKRKGGLQMETVADLLKGGEAGPALVRGKPEESELLRRVHLPETDDKHMPPAGKPPLTESEIAIVTWWIQAGAPDTERAGDLKLPAEVLAAIDEQMSPEARAKLAVQKKADAEKMEASLDAIRRGLPGKLSAIVPGEPALAYEVGGDYAQVGDDQLQRLAPICENLRAVYLPRAPVTDRSVPLFARMKNVDALFLQSTAIGDGTLAAVAALPALQTLNVYDTKITDAGLAKLAGAKQLRALYVANTPVSPEAIRALSQALPQLKINDGSAVPAAAAQAASNPPPAKP